MTVAQETNKIVYDCDDVTTEFSFSFKIFEKGNLKVTITDSEDNETILTLTTDYIVSGNLEDGGKITTIATWATGNTLTIELDMDLEQSTDLIYGGNYSSEAVETMVDRTVKMIQQLRTAIDEVEGGGGNGSISDEAFSGAWNGVSNVGASKNALWDKLESFGSAVDRNAEDIMSDGANLPDGHAVKVYGDAHWLSGINPYGSPVQYDYARFSDASHIEGRSYTEVRADLNIADGATKYPDTGEQAFLDADHTKLDGIESGATTDQTANEILALLKTVDGTGSELDADLVDGSNPGSAFTRDAEDVLTDGANLPDGAAIKTYGDANWGGYTNLTSFIEQTAWRLFYSNTGGDVVELALGTNGQYLKANGLTSAPTWSTPSGNGDVVGPGTHAADYVPQWNGTPNSKTLVAGFAITVAGKALISDADAAAQRTTLGLGSAALRAAEDTLSDGSNLPDGHAIKTYGDANWGGGASGDKISEGNSYVEVIDTGTGRIEIVADATEMLQIDTRGFEGINGADAFSIDSSDVASSWAGWGYKAGFKFRRISNEDIGSGNHVREGYVLEMRDSSTSGAGHRLMTHGLRVAAGGVNAAGNYVNSAKDIVGIVAEGFAKTTQWDARGASGICANAYQYGTGVCTNEFTAQSRDGGAGQSVQLAGVMALVNPDYRAWNYGGGDRLYSALELQNLSSSNEAKHAMRVNGKFWNGIDLTGTTITGNGIRMSQSVAGSVIEYDSNDYTKFEGNTFGFVIGGSTKMSLNSNKLYLTSANVELNTFGQAFKGKDQGGNMLNLAYAGIAGQCNIGYGCDSLTLGSNSSSDDPVWIRVRAIQKQVTMGTIDSGGSGYRVLRVAN